MNFISHQPPPKTPDCIQIKPRKIDFSITRESADNWYLGDESIPLFLNAISMLFPIGEQLFIDSVKNYKHKIVDPILQEQIAGFLAQEALHSKEHAHFNSHLKETAKVEKMLRFCFNMAKAFPKRTQLAFTCAFEHFTALLANLLLVESESFMKKSDLAVARLWMWHAIEEIEHKSVCYDVYQTVAGGFWGYFERCLVMLIITLCFAIQITIALIIHRSFRQKKQVTATKTLVNLNAPFKKTHRFKTLGVYINLIRKIIKPYFSYYVPFFHPWNDDNSHLVEKWKLSLEKTEGIQTTE